ncbi:MAG: hypothetical protein R3D57_04265 [Hyphomicrobiaceae bacterium]
MRQATLTRMRVGIRIVAAAVLAAGLSGCGMGSLSSGWLGSQAEPEAASPSLIGDPMLSAVPDGGQGASATASVGTPCPEFVVWPNDRLLTVYADGRDGDSLAVVHRGEITQTARECTIQPGLVTVKFGFSGRVLLGPKGAPGVVNLPVNVFVTDANREKIQTEPVAVQSEITVEKPIGYFSAVRTVSFAIPEGSRPADYKLYVAFDKGPAA